MASPNYMLRPAKNVVRKLIGEALLLLSGKFDLSAYRYVGFGGLWFADFVLFHKLLRINDMISIEGDRNFMRRAQFNRPFDCIRVEEGESTLVLPDLNLGEKPAVVWLDYTHGIAGPVLQDTKIVIENVPSGSVLLVTLNADHRQLSNPEPGGGAREPKRVLGEFAGLPHERVPLSATTRGGFPPFLAETLFDILRHTTRVSSGGLREFIPLVNFFYEDGSAMVTLGGIVADGADQARVASTAIKDRLEYITGIDQQYKVSIPVLTPKEKLTLDRLLPSARHPTVEDVENEGFLLKELELMSYHRLYRFYPMFGEMLG